MAKKATKKAKRPKGGGVNEAAAFSIYCEIKEDGKKMTLREVAEKIGAHPKTLEGIAVKGNWKELRKNHGKVEKDGVVKTLGELVAEKNQKHLQMFEDMADMGMTILKKEQKAYNEVVAIQDNPNRRKAVVPKRMRRFSVGKADIGHRMLLEGIKGARVALGLPTDVTRSTALNLNVVEELPQAELQGMQSNLDRNYNKRDQTTPAVIDGENKPTNDSK